MFKSLVCLDLLKAPRGKAGFDPTVCCCPGGCLTTRSQGQRWLQVEGIVCELAASRPSNKVVYLRDGGRREEKKSFSYVVNTPLQKAPFNYHLYSKLRFCRTEQCPCCTDSQTTEHLLQSCPIYELPRKEIWPYHTPVARKLYGSLGDLRCTATFIEETGVSTGRKEEEKAPC